MHLIILNWFKTYGPGLIYSALIFTIGLMIAFTLKKLLQKYIHVQNNEMLKRFLINIFMSFIILLTIISALGKLGVPTASLVAVMGAAGLAIALSLKDFLSNIAAGVMIVFLKPFSIGDTVTISSNTGTVTDLNLFMIALQTSTNECVWVPNNKVLTSSILNSSFYDKRRIDLTVGVNYDTDLSVAKDIVLKVMKDNKLVLNDPAPVVGVQELTDQSINLLVRYWVDQSNTTQSQLEVLETIKFELSKAKIKMPSQQPIHINFSEKFMKAEMEDTVSGS